MTYTGKWKLHSVMTFDDSDMPTPTGFIQILPGSMANMVIDNIKITNLDAVPNLVEYEYVTNKWPEIHDYEYTQPKFTYRDEVVSGEAGFNYYIITLIGAAVCVVALGATVVVLTILKKKKAKALAAASQTNLPLTDGEAATDQPAEEEVKTDE